jgi:hypothetical protein
MATQLINDLTHIPNIIASLGLAIAQSQRQMDLEYLESLERLVVMAQSLLGGMKKSDGKGGQAELSGEEKQRFDQFSMILKEFLVALAPSRYQFSETTLTVRLDLAQHLDVSAGGGVSAGIGGVAINAAFSVGFGSDYRGAAECKTVLHAVPVDANTLRTMLDRAKDLGQKDLSLPERSAVDKQLHAQSERLFERMVGCKPAGISDEKSPTGAPAASPEKQADK